MITVNKFLFRTGVILLAAGTSYILLTGIKSVSRRIHRAELLKTSTVLEIPELDIKVPVLESTENDVISEACGHFEGTGDRGSGNYCVAGHSSPLYKCDFNSLKNAEEGMNIKVTYNADECYNYRVNSSFTVNPDEVWVLGDFGDDRITLVTCTDDGTQRLIVTGVIVE